MTFKNMSIISKSVLCGAVALGFIACGGKTNDPATLGKGDLNPPRNVMSLTGDGKVELRFETANAEDDLKGYDVFVYKGKLATVKAAVTYPSTTIDLAKGSIPRCAGNNAAFKLFGFATDSTADCTGAKATKASGAASVVSDGQFLADAAAATEKLTNLVKCETGSTAVGTADISMPITTLPSLDSKKCVISKLSDGTAFANGETYTFYVAAVAGDDFSKISWTSNFVEDTPSKSVFSGNVVLDTQEYVYFTVDATSATTVATAITAPSDVKGCNASVCDVNAKNTETTPAGFLLYVGRDIGASNAGRIWFSAPEASGVLIQARGGQTVDPLAPTVVSPRIPGDQAVTEYAAAGTKFAVYGNQVFDIKVTSGSTVYYGKVVFDEVSFAPVASDGTSTVKVTIIIQSQPGQVEYLQ